MTGYNSFEVRLVAAWIYQQDCSSGIWNHWPIMKNLVSFGFFSGGVLICHRLTVGLPTA